MSAGNWLVMAGGLSAAAAVALGAFGAHALGGRLDEGMRAAWETGVHYHGLHAVAVIALGGLVMRSRGAIAVTVTAGWLLMAGQLLFAGSLYALALTGWDWLGPITPLGGLALILGWLVLAWAHRPWA